MSRSTRKNFEIRPLTFESGVLLNAEGSCLVKCGNTHVLCSASLEEKVPSFLRGKGEGWLTAEYCMLPRANAVRSEREGRRIGGVSGRTKEIERLIGRSLRACIDFKALGERQFLIDADVINADGGTRTASINGGFIALSLVCNKLVKSGLLKKNPIKFQVCAISVGISAFGEVITDMDYTEDSTAKADGNFVLDENFKIIEAQVSSEKENVSKQDFTKMLEFAENACQVIFKKQKEFLANHEK